MIRGPIQEANKILLNTYALYNRPEKHIKEKKNRTKKRNRQSSSKEVEFNNIIYSYNLQNTLKNNKSKQNIFKLTWSTYLSTYLSIYWIIKQIFKNI